MIYAELRWESPIKEMTPEQFEVFRANWPGLRKDVEQDKCYVSGTQRISLEEAAAIQDAGIKLELTGVDGTMITKIKDNPAKKWGHHDYPGGRDILDGTAVQITLPDVGLLVIDEVTWREDECTEEIQRMLDEGWRIIAVCPPNAQRRPDYILGRRKARPL